MTFIPRCYSIAIIIITLCLLSCSGNNSGDNDLSLEQQHLALLAKNWRIKSAMQDVDRTADFKSPDLTIKLSGTFNAGAPKGPYTYVVSGNAPIPSPWSMQPGLWNFASDASNTIVRDDGVRMQYAVTDTTLTLTFTCSTCNNDGGRVNSAEGNWVFEFVTP